MYKYVSCKTNKQAYAHAETHTGTCKHTHTHTQHTLTLTNTHSLTHSHLTVYITLKINGRNALIFFSFFGIYMLCNNAVLVIECFAKKTVIARIVLIVCKQTDISTFLQCLDMTKV